MASVDDYLALITSEHRDKPNFVAVVSAAVKPFVDGINALAAIPAKFDVDLAQGQQLDYVGEWVNLPRQLLAPITGVYFALDTPDVGFDQGYLKGENDPADGPIELDDPTYRLLIYAKIAANIWDGSLEDAQAILASIFESSPGTHLFIEDNQDMSIDIGISGVIPNALFVAALEQGYFEVRGAGVLINAVFINPGPFFGLDVQNYNISGFDTGVFT